MNDLEGWLHNLSARPLPGSVSAAAVAAAMGAALIAKAARVTLRRQAMTPADRAAMQAVLDLARDQQPILLRLADADERAYRTVLRARAPSPAAWREATEVPIRLAEACRSLLRPLPGVLDPCWPAVRPDLEIGSWFLEVAVRAGRLAAEINLRAWGEDPAAGPLRARVDALSPKGKG